MPVVLWNHEYQAQWLSDLGVWRAHSLKNWSTRCVVQTIYFSSKAGSWRFPSDSMVLCQGWGLQKGCITAFSTHFHVDTFSFSFCVGLTQLVFWISFRGNCSMYSCSSVSMGGENSGASYVAILVQSPMALLVRV